MESKPVVTLYMLKLWVVGGLTEATVEMNLGLHLITISLMSKGASQES